MSASPERPRLVPKKRKRKTSPHRRATDGTSGGQGTKSARAEAAPKTERWSPTSVLAVVAIATAVVGIPLYLKSTPPPGAKAEPPTAAAVEAPKALPRFVDLGTTTCVPCKVMLGVMEELKRDYPGAFIVEFVNVKEDPDGAGRYGIQTIPTQIFFAPDGRELYRHLGVFRAEQVIAKWDELGYHFEPVAGE